MDSIGIVFIFWGVFLFLAILSAARRTAQKDKLKKDLKKEMIDAIEEIGGKEINVSFDQEHKLKWLINWTYVTTFLDRHNNPQKLWASVLVTHRGQMASQIQWHRDLVSILQNRSDDLTLSREEKAVTSLRDDMAVLEKDIERLKQASSPPTDSYDPAEEIRRLKQNQ